MIEKGKKWEILKLIAQKPDNFYYVNYKNNCFCYTCHTEVWEEQ